MGHCFLNLSVVTLVVIVTVNELVLDLLVVDKVFQTGLVDIDHHTLHIVGEGSNTLVINITTQRKVQMFVNLCQANTHEVTRVLVGGKGSNNLGSTF